VYRPVDDTQAINVLFYIYNNEYGPTSVSVSQFRSLLATTEENIAYEL